MKKTPFGKTVAAIEDKARFYGYKTKKEIAIFVNGYITGFASLLVKEPKPKRVKK